MDNKAIETLAVSAIRDSVVLSPYLDEFIQTNDKEPSVDGFVNLYKPAEKTKDNFYGRVAVQIKGTLKNIKKNVKQLSYRVCVNDLKFFLKEGGILFFVVIISPNGKVRRVFYNELLPVKIQSIVKLLKGKKTKMLKFKELTDAKQIANLFFGFYNEAQKQVNAKISLPSYESIDDLQKSHAISAYTMTTPNAFGYTDPIDALLNCDTYIYAQLKDTHVLLPQRMMGDESKREVIYDVNNIVSAGNSIYEGYKVKREKDNTTLIIDNWFFFSFRLAKSNGAIDIKFQFKSRSTIIERIKDNEFIIAFIREGGFSINNAFYNFISGSTNVNIKNIDVDKLKKETDFLKQVLKLFEILHIKEDIDLSELKQSDINNLEMLITALVYEKPFNRLPENTPNNFFLQIGTLGISLYWKEIDGNKYIWNMLSNSARCEFSMYDGTRHHAPIYVMVDKDGWNKISNIDYENILSEFKNIYDEHKETDIFKTANNTFISLLLAYDESGKLCLLKVAESIAEWILNNETDVDYVSTINYLQVIARKRKLTDTEKMKLTLIAENTTASAECRTASYLLLDNQVAAELHFSDISAETQEGFQQWPICHFWKNRAVYSEVGSTNQNFA